MSDFNLIEIKPQLDRIEANLDHLIDGPKPEIIPVGEVMRITGCNSVSAPYRLLPELGVKPYVKGKYRRVEIKNAIAKLALMARLESAK